MKVDRLVSIIMILLDKKRIGAQELADMFEVSPRTIYRDIDAINLAGIPVLSTPGVGGGFEIMQQYKLDKKVFSSSELSAILTGLYGLSEMMHSRELENALAKVKSFIPADKAGEITLKTGQLWVDLTPWLENRDLRPYLEMVKTALEENRLLSFEYIDGHGNKTVRTAEPYRLVLKNGHWYWQGYCYKRKDFRLFRLSRTLKLGIQDVYFTPKECPDPQLSYADEAAAMQTKIKIRIHKSIMDRVLDNCAYEQLLPDGDAHFVVVFPFIENEYYYDMLLGFGNKCECLSPPHVRAEMKRRIQIMAGLYQEDL